MGAASTAPNFLNGVCIMPLLDAACDFGGGARKWYIMTVQRPEVLEYEGKWYSLCTLPLEAYLARLPSPPSFFATPTCLERMYIRHWRIEKDRLFLIGLQAHDREGNAITLGHLFPGSSGPVRAEWYSGVLRCPLGKRLKTILFAFDSIYEADLLFPIEQGRLIGIERRTNPLPLKQPEEEMDMPAFLRRYPDPGPS